VRVHPGFPDLPESPLRIRDQFLATKASTRQKPGNRVGFSPHSLQVLYSFGLSSHRRDRVDGLGSSLGYVLDPLARDESHFGPRAILIEERNKWLVAK